MTTRAAHAETVANARAKVFDSFANGELTMAQFNADIDALIAAVRHEAGADRLHPSRKAPSADLVQSMRRKAEIIRRCIRMQKHFGKGFTLQYDNDDLGSFALALEQGATALECADLEIDRLHPHEDGVSPLPRQAQEVDTLPRLTIEQAVDDLRVAWSPDEGLFSREECEERLQKLITAVRADALLLLSDPQSAPPEDEQTDQARSGNEPSTRKVEQP